ncbi:MAG: sugar-binding protein [Selenomonadaceae bacterium]|nr:sugar-binding protein [Selenomonadaceae bacterium]MBR1859370.1 sugar-binding protein [Selenomonadaceae bacterium]
MIKRFIIMVMIAAMTASALLISGCDDSDSNNKKVAIAFPNTTPSWQRNGEAMMKTLQEEGFTVDLQFAGTSDEQINQVKEIIETQPNCLVIGAIDGAAFVDVLERAKELNVPIIAFDRIILNTDAVNYYASFDNEAIGEAMGEYLEAALNLKGEGGPYNIEFFAGAPSDNNAHLFFKNSMAVLEPYIKSGKLICLSGQTDFNSVATADWNSDNAKTRIKNLLDTYYNAGQPLHAVLSPNDDIAGVILAEMQARNMSLPLISGLDADPAAIERIKAGQQTFTVSKSPELLTNKCVRMIKAVVEGTDPDINDVSTYNNGKITVPAYLCTPYIIDKDNVNNN